jgi:hypothetical protein
MTTADAAGHWQKRLNDKAGNGVAGVGTEGRRLMLR